MVFNKQLDGGEFIVAASMPSNFCISRLSWFKDSSSFSVTISFGFGNSKYLGGKTRGFFFFTKNSSLLSDLVPLKPSLIDWQAVKAKQATKIINI